MDSQRNRSAEAESLPRTAQTRRERAEEIARQQAAQLPVAPKALSPEEIQRMFHEQRVHQIEREMQNAELQQACAELDLARARYVDLYEQAPLSYLSLDAAGCVLEVNQAWLALLEYTRAQVLGRWFGDFLAPHELDAFKERFPRFLTTGEMHVDSEMVRGDRTHLIVHCDGRRRRDDRGEFQQTHCIFYDITAHKQLEDALRRSELELQLTLDATTDGIWKWNFKTNTLFFSPRYYTMLGYAPDESPATYENWKALIHPDDLPTALAVAETYLATKPDTYENEFRLKTKTGDYRWIHTQARVVERDTDGTAVRMIGNHADITARKHQEAQLLATQAELQRAFEIAEQSRQALLTMVEDQEKKEEEVRRLDAELEQRVHERTAQLQAANQELEAFAYSVSHDLRAPLRALDGFSTALSLGYASQMDAQAQHYLRRIQEATHRMGRLINDLLDLSRVTRSPIISQPVDLSALAREIAGGLQARDPQRQAEFIIAPQIIAHGDASLLRIVLENLLDNAWKFTGLGAYARIEFGAMEEAGTRVLFVRDNGVGFDMAYADKLFAPFQRLHGAHQFPGTGIGLATVRRIITRHGGRIWVQAAVNQGATWYFTLDSAR